MDPSIGLPIGMGSALILAGILFWYTYRNQTEPEGGRGSEEQIDAELAAKIKREIELELQYSLKDNEDVDEALEAKTSSQSF